MSINYLRQLDILQNYKFNEEAGVTIIGAGASGSCLAFMIAQMGIDKIDIWDFDQVESHNLPNQIYDIADEGKNKVDALASILKRKSGVDIQTHNERVSAGNLKKLNKYVFLQVDSMSGRKEIFDTCIWRKSFSTDLVIETRLGPDAGHCYSFNPNSVSDVEEWRKTLYGDDQAQTSACGATSTIAPTVWFLAAMAAWRMIHHFDVNYGHNFTKAKGKDEAGFDETVFQLGPEMFYSRRFKK